MAVGHGVLRQLLATFYFDIEGVDRRKFDKSIKDLAAAFAGGAIAKGIASFVDDSVKSIMAVRNAALELGISTDRVQQFTSAAGALGLQTSMVTLAMSRLEIAVGMAGRGSKRQVAALRDLGVSAKDANGKVKPLDALFLEVAQGISKMSDQNKRALVTLDLFGRAGHKLLPFLREGKGGLAALIAEFDKLGGGYSKKAIKATEEYNVQTSLTEHLLKNVVGFIMEQWLPVLGKQQEKLRGVVMWFREMYKNSLLAKAGLYVLQGAMALFALRTALAFPTVTALTLALGLLVLALDDVMVWFDGGDSLIGRSIDAMFGKGQSLATVNELKDTWKAISEFVSATWKEIKNIWGIEEQAPDKADSNTETEAEQHAREFKAYKGDEDYGDSAADDTVGYEKYIKAQFKYGNDVHAIVNGIVGDQLRDWFPSRDMFPGGNAQQPVTVGDINVTVTPPAGADAKQVGSTAGKAVSDAIHEHVKRAMSTLPRKATQ